MEKIIAILSKIMRIYTIALHAKRDSTQSVMAASQHPANRELRRRHLARAFPPGYLPAAPLSFVDLSVLTLILPLFG